jgi:hypothetical protein
LYDLVRETVKHPTVPQAQLMTQRLQYLASMLFVVTWVALVWLTSAGALWPNHKERRGTLPPGRYEIFLGMGLLTIALLAGLVDVVSRTFLRAKYSDPDHLA